VEFSRKEKKEGSRREIISLCTFALFRFPPFPKRNCALFYPPGFTEEQNRSYPVIRVAEFDYNHTL